MGVLLAKQVWPALSELWLKRQITGIADDVVAFAAYEPQSSHYDNSIPSIRLANPPMSLFCRGLRKLGMGVLTDERSPDERLGEAIAESDVDSVLVHYLDFAVKFRDTLTNCSKPVFIHCHGYDTKWDLRYHDRPDDRVHDPRYVNRAKELSQSCTLIANSEHLKRRLLEAGIDESRIVVKYYGIPAPASPPAPRPQRTNVEILYLGRLCDCKGPDLTIRAFEVACERGLKGNLTIAGDGELMMTCQLLWRRSPYRDRIRMLGAVTPELGQRLRDASDIFTAHNCIGRLSSEDEALGASILEAMADGIPVVTGRQGGVCETIADGETGLLFLPEDIHDHADALMILAENAKLRNQMGYAGWQRVHEQFSVQKEVHALRQILGLSKSRKQVSAEPLPALQPAQTT